MKNDTVNIGVCWYKEEQWERLKEIVSDPDNIEETYQQWRKDAEKTLTELKANRVDIKKVSVDTEEMLIWANEHGRPLDGEARSEYAAHILQGRENSI
ncbi:MAG: hypothetical protein U9R74_13160 [Pseudomonadota bacterium]|nr:hypothetical protein [Pseudomonadota bacterium]